MPKHPNADAPSPPNARRTRSKGSAEIAHTLSQVEHCARELKKRLRTSKEDAERVEPDIADDDDDDEVESVEKRRPVRKGKNVMKTKARSIFNKRACELLII